MRFIGVKMTEISQLEILLIDDSDSVRNSYRDLFVGVGTKLGLKIKVATAVDGQEGIDAYLRMLSEGGPDAVITDVDMPNKNGYDVVRFIKGFRPVTPVYVMTGDITEEAFREREAEFKRLNADHVYKKPIEVGTMREILDDILAKKRAGYESASTQPTSGSSPSSPPTASANPPALSSRIGGISASDPVIDGMIAEDYLRRQRVQPDQGIQPYR